MGEAVNAVSRFPSTPHLEKLEEKMAGQVGRDVLKSAKFMSVDNKADDYHGMVVSEQTKASAAVLTQLKESDCGLVSLDRWIEIEKRLRDAFELGLEQAKEMYYK